MNKSELVAKIAEITGFTKTDANKSLDAVFEAISGALAEGDEVRLIGFGTFYVAKRPQMEGHNPRTGASIVIPPSNQPKFKASSVLKDAVNK